MTTLKDSSTQKKMDQNSQTPPSGRYDNAVEKTLPTPTSGQKPDSEPKQSPSSKKPTKKIHRSTSDIEDSGDDDDDTLTPASSPNQPLTEIARKQILKQTILKRSVFPPSQK